MAYNSALNQPKFGTTRSKPNSDHTWTFGAAVEPSQNKISIPKPAEQSLFASQNSPLYEFVPRAISADEETPSAKESSPAPKDTDIPIAVAKETKMDEAMTEISTVSREGLPFSKYHGNGNDFILIDNQQNVLNDFLAIRSFVRKMCDRRTGIGADGVVALSTEKTWPPTAMTSLRPPTFQFPSYQMTYYNSDGAEGTFCGNGARCLVAFACKLGIVKQTKCFNFSANDGQHSGSYFTPSMVKVRMGDVERVEILSLTDYFVDTGSPHYVTYVDQLDAHDVIKEGRRIRWSQAYERFGGCNVNFVQKRRVGDDVMTCRTYERGVEDETQSCGTGVVAVALADYVNGRRQLSSSRKEKDNSDDVKRIPEFSNSERDPIRSIRSEVVNKQIRMKGGELEVTFEVTYEGESSDVKKFVNIDLTGPATHVYSGKYFLQ